jgi:NhaP-type Na+/H+ or K+/H+ antiporter
MLQRLYDLMLEYPVEFFMGCCSGFIIGWIIVHFSRRYP